MDTQNLAEVINSSPANKGVDGAEWLAEFQSEPDNITMMYDTGAVLFEYVGNAVYEVHFLFAKTAKGRDVIADSKTAFDQLFTNVDRAELIMGLVPDELENAKLHARLVGGKSIGHRDTPYGRVELFVLSREMWEDKQ